MNGSIKKFPSLWQTKNVGSSTPLFGIIDQFSGSGCCKMMHKTRNLDKDWHKYCQNARSEICDALKLANENYRLLMSQCNINSHWSILSSCFITLEPVHLYIHFHLTCHKRLKIPALQNILGEQGIFVTGISY